MNRPQKRSLPTDAAGWFVRRNAGDLTLEEAAALEAWLAGDPRHGDSLAVVEQAWGAAGPAGETPAVLARREALRRARDTRTRRLAMRALAATLALGVLGGGAVAVRVLSGPRALVTQDFHTAVGQRATVGLPDGSRVTLNTDTVVRTVASRDRRLVYLDRGQAYFQVAKDAAHPFVVTAAGRTVTALGTAFDVRIDRGALKVTLVEGKVRVEAPVRVAAAAPVVSRRNVQATEMVAGSELIAPDDETWLLVRTNAVRDTSWTRGQIIFDDRPLSEVVAELNRYSDQKMVVSDPGLAATPISGTFKPGDTHGFLKSLEAYRLARAGGETASRVEVEPF